MYARIHPNKHTLFWSCFLVRERLYLSRRHHMPPNFSLCLPTSACGTWTSRNGSQKPNKHHKQQPWRHSMRKTSAKFRGPKPQNTTKSQLRANALKNRAWMGSPLEDNTFLRGRPFYLKIHKLGGVTKFIFYAF